MSLASLWKRIFGGVYSAIASNLYEPLIVNFGFKVLGKRLAEAIHVQSMLAAEAAGTRPVLDVPVGTAAFTIGLARIHEGPTLGADIAWGMVRESRRRAAAAGVEMPVLQADADALPFPDEIFGAVLCSNGLQVMPALDPPLRELHRVVRRGGPVFATVPMIPLGTFLPERMAARLPVFFSSKAVLRAAFEHAGFEVTKLRRSRLVYLVEAVRSA